MKNYKILLFEDLCEEYKNVDLYTNENSIKISFYIDWGTKVDYIHNFNYRLYKIKNHIKNIEKYPISQYITYIENDNMVVRNNLKPYQYKEILKLVKL